MDRTIDEAGAIIGITPFERPDARLAASICDAGFLGVLDLGHRSEHAHAALNHLRDKGCERFGIRIGDQCPVAPDDPLLATRHGKRIAVLSADHAWSRVDAMHRFRVIAEVRNVQEARVASACGAIGLIARGDEAGGCGSTMSSFILLQALLADADIHLPIWLCGGIGLHSAGAALIGGATGIVLDSQLALLDESDLPGHLRAAVRRLDGTETQRIAGARQVKPGPRPDAHARGLPAGQDVYLARRFEERWQTVAKAFCAMRAAIGELAWRSDPAIDLGSPDGIRATLKTDLPLLQGPMTRVSDQPAFALAVARTGALPFIALALLDAGQTRDLLTQTRDMLGAHPWGVGILGFAPEETRTAQIDAIKILKPSHAIISGGNPAQAAALEEVGITTFLHAPSPILLGQYLDAGARRFIFEGAECGGHVGPRNSFPLWEAQIDVIERFLATSEGRHAAGMDVVFAGGIHDARSVAMIMGLAHSLVARGVRVGVLMGSAYLFTEEAVACGAIQPLFQQQVLDATETALLETAPGHATRCIRSVFTDEFRDIRRQHGESGIDGRESWLRLEHLNVGRLRIASKGIERQGDQLLPIAPGEQRERGMFMAGDVALLRHSRTRLDELHKEVSAHAASFYEAQRERLRSFLPALGDSQRPLPCLDVAIVGMACVFPGANNLDEFWASILDGHDGVAEVPAARWDTRRYGGVSPSASGDSSSSKWGAFIPAVPFDALHHGIPPTSMASIEPVQLLSLQVACQALEDAGYAKGDFDRSRTSVIFGAEGGSDLRDAMVLRSVLPTYMEDIPAGLEAQLPKFTEDSFPGSLSNIIAGRIANRLDLGGSNFTVDAACASSLAALDAACKALADGSSDMVLCGGADLHNGIGDFLLFTSVGALSPTGRSRPFDEKADGIVLGEGIACVVLKRLADAKRDGDRVYAVVKGIGATSDGKALGLTAPRSEGQRDALERAYRQAHCSPSQVGLVEAHGTGTVVGDRTELATLERVFAQAGAGKGSCALGSVKSQIGHTKCAAGLAGLIKTAMAIHTGIVPPTFHIDRPNSSWRELDSPFRFHSMARPWCAPTGARLAGVSAFGFGGTNFHTVMSSDGASLAPRHGRRLWPCELILVRGESRADAFSSLKAVLDRIQRQYGDIDFPSLAASLCAGDGTGDHPVQYAFVADDTRHLATLIEGILRGQSPADGSVRVRDRDAADAGKLAFLFPGQGSQKVDMLRDLLVTFPDLGGHLAHGHRHADILFPAQAFDDASRQRQRDAIKDTAHAQPCLGMVSMSACRLLENLGIRADASIGHSYGELVALWHAGVYSSGSLIRLSEHRARCILDAVGDAPGTMAAIGARADVVEALLGDLGISDIVCANRNGPRQTVISGPVSSMEDAVSRIGEHGMSATRLAVACAFHSPIVAGAGEKFRPFLDAEAIASPRHPVWANRTAMPYPSDPDAIRAELAAQLSAPVRFSEQIEEMYAQGVRVFVEVGPGRALSGLTGDILGGRPHTAIPIDDRNDGSLRGFLQAVAALAVCGIRIGEDWLFTGRTRPERRSRPAGWLVDGQLVRTADGEPLPNGLKPAIRVSTNSRQAAGDPRIDAERLISDFIDGSSRAISAQRDVLLQYLSDTAPIVGRREARPGTDAESPLPGPSTGPAHGQPADATPAGAGSLSSADMVVALISERTGYPAHMIDRELDLEADLSIDSIKRAEIAGQLIQWIRSREADERKTDAVSNESIAERFSSARTVAAISSILDEFMTSGGSAQMSPSPAGDISDAMDVIVGIICERTGYPANMIEPGLDLEADLSIDSIKRTEIAGLIAQRFGFALSEAHIAELATARTPAAMVEWASGKHARPPSPIEVAAISARAPGRYIQHRASLAASVLPARGLEHQRVLLFAHDGPRAQALAGALRDRGATVLLAKAPFDTGILEAPDGVIVDLDATGGAFLLPTGYPNWRTIIVARPGWLLGLSSDERAKTGIDGFFRSVAKETPERLCRLVLGHPDGELSSWARDVVDEIGDREPHPVVWRDGKRREHLITVACPIHGGMKEGPIQGIDRGSVILVFGGARGITARIATALASATGCHLVLIGRTPGPSADTVSAYPEAVTIEALRGAISAREPLAPAEVEKRARAILDAREVASTLDAIERDGGSSSYRSLDISDSESVRALFDDVLATHGSVDGVIHAAGVIDDRLVVDKDASSFHRVFSTKVDGARHILDQLDRLALRPAFVSLFGSIAAIAGNRGQADYAAANAALETMATDWSKSTGNRAFVVHWGPWAPTGSGRGGMVSAELAREYVRRGVHLIEPDAGAAAFLDELASTDAGHAGGVIHTSTDA